MGFALVTARSGKTPTQFRTSDSIAWMLPANGKQGVEKWPQDILVLLYLCFLRTLS